MSEMTEAEVLHSHVFNGIENATRAEGWLHASDLIIEGATLRGLMGIAGRHAPKIPWGMGFLCGHCVEGDGVNGMWPCPDFRDVAAAVGVEIEEG